MSDLKATLSSGCSPTTPSVEKFLTSASGQDDWFTKTHWSVVLSAGDPSSPLAAEALERLCRTYWHPLYAYLRRDGKNKETAEDLTQGFFERLLRLNSLTQVQREKGKFR